MITEQDLEDHIRAQAQTASRRLTQRSLTLPQAVAQLEEQMIREALETCHFNQVHTAKRLGLSRQGLIKKMKRLGIDSTSRRSLGKKPAARESLEY